MKIAWRSRLEDALLSAWGTALIIFLAVVAAVLMSWMLVSLPR